ncbi:hypothetical protein RIF29_24064 [Crotalaria pallida]|uniref:Secreted protein n=1 Tax=Crotalaria pallida TaxID=3830 RepID=A0AAN9EL99_CROPI
MFCMHKMFLLCNNFVLVHYSVLWCFVTKENYFGIVKQSNVNKAYLFSRWTTILSSSTTMARPSNMNKA